MTLDFDGARRLASRALDQHLPQGRDGAWLRQLVDEPRFGWDCEALERGFTQPLAEWAARHDARLRPVLAALLMQALGVRADDHAGVCAALELHHLAAIMLDDLRNGRDLGSSTTEAVQTPLAVWVTIAYNVRQLVPVLAERRVTSLAAPQRQALVVALSRFLFAQGLGSTLDLWWGEHPPPRCDVVELSSHLRLYAGTLSFGLACHAASICAAGSEAEQAQWARCGNDLGVALRLGALSRGQLRHLVLKDTDCMEQRVRFPFQADAAALQLAGRRLAGAAIDRAHQLAPAGARALAGFGACFEPAWFAESAR